jgi:hypothetical protein
MISKKSVFINSLSEKDVKLKCIYGGRLMYNYFRHSYSLAVVGLKHGLFGLNKVFYSRQEANEYMYKLCQKHGLKIEKIWDDNHDKTYHCNKGVSFYIHRV